MRTLLALVRLTTLLAPLVILTFWGGSYLYACIRFLANPQKAVELRYQAKDKQPVLLTASSYVVDLEKGDLSVLRPRAVNTVGDVLFYADIVRAVGLPTLFGDAKRAVVDVRNAYGTIIRKPNGDLDIFDYLPKREGPSGNYPFVVNVNQGKVKLIEATGKRRYVQNASITDLKVNGVGDRWIASGYATLHDVGDLWLSIQNQPTSGVWLRGNTESLQLAELFRVFRQTKEGLKTPALKDVHFKSLVVYGPFELFVPANRSARLYSEVNAVAEGFRYRDDYYADRARFSGIATAAGLQGTLTASNADLDAVYRGFAGWEGGFRMDGDLNAKAANLAALPRPLRAAFPSELKIAGPIDFDGRLAYDRDRGIRANGIGNAASLAMFGETVTDPRLLIDYDPGGYRFAAQQGNWRGAPVTGSIAMDGRTRNLSGSFQVARVDLDGLAKRFKIANLSGKADLDVLVSGTSAKPIAHIRASTDHRYAWTPQMQPHRGTARLAATLENNRLRVEQAYMVSPAGSLSATGFYDLNTRKLDMAAIGSGVDLQVLNPELNGIGRFKGSINGTLDRIQYQGKAELFGLKVRDQTIPVVTGLIQGDSKSVTFADLNAVKGAGKAKGTVNLRYRDMALDGRFDAEGIQLNDFLGENYLANIDLTDARLTGTFSKPMFNANGRATDIVILGSRIDGAEAVVTYEGDILKIDDFTAKVGQGAVTGYLEYRPAQKFGQANFTAENIAVEHFIRPEVAATLSGVFSGEGGFKFNEGGFQEGSAAGQINNILLNETLLGSGEWNLSAVGGVLAGDLFFGELDRSVDVTVRKYGIESREVDASLWVRNMQVPDVHNIVEQYLPKWDERILTLLRGTEGSLGVSGSLTGNIDDLNVVDGGFTAENLVIGGRPGGTFRTQFDKSGRLWKFEDIDWAGGPIGIKAVGAFEEGGMLEFEGNIDNADLSYLSLYEPSLSSLTGQIDSWFDLSGATKNPVLRASPLSDRTAELAGIGFKNKEGVLEHPVNFAFSSLVVSNWADGRGGFEGSARVEHEGYSGDLILDLPFRFPFEFVAEAPVSAQLKLDEREVKDVEQLTVLFDPKKSVGRVAGIVNLTGTAADPQAAGDLSLTAERLVFNEGGQELRDVTAGLQIFPRRLGANLSATSALGGSVQANATSTIPSIDDILKLFRENRFEDLYKSPVAGVITANDLSVRTNFGDGGVAQATVTTDLALSGTLKRPELKGDVLLPRAYLKMPDEFEPQAKESELKIEPYFDLQVRTESAKFDNSTANIEMSGSGTVNGTLEEMDAFALLRLTRGVLLLPTSRINLEPGGIVRPYLAINQGITDARLDIEIEGNTRAVGPSKVGQGAQRYDIHMDIRGDLLQDGGLTLSATSSPADLSQDEIFALIGRLDLIEGLASGVQSGSPEADIRNAIYGLTPYYLDPYTSKLAQMFGLDYITPEINTIDGISILFAKTLGRNLVLSGSRQVTQVNQNYPIKYDLNLAYTMRFGSRTRQRRVSFIVGTNEVRPWRIAVEYSFRF